MFVPISAYKLVRFLLYLQSFVGWLMSYLRYMCLFVHSGVQQCIRLLYPMLQVSLDCPYLIAPSVFSDFYIFMIYMNAITDMILTINISHFSGFNYIHILPCKNIVCINFK